MTRRTAAAIRAAQHLDEVEADIVPSRARFARLFGDVTCSEPVTPVVHTTRIERDGARCIFRCECHAFGTWTTEAKASAEAEAHKQKPWRKL